MKNLITMMACVMLLLTFLTEFVQSQQLALRIGQAERITDFYCQVEDMEGMQRELSRVMGCGTEDIRLVMTEAKRGEKVVKSYRVEIPVEKILASPKFWGIDETENKGMHTLEREVVYE